MQSFISAMARTAWKRLSARGGTSRTLPAILDVRICGMGPDGQFQLRSTKTISVNSQMSV